MKYLITIELFLDVEEIRGGAPNKFDLFWFFRFIGIKTSTGKNSQIDIEDKNQFSQRWGMFWPGKKIRFEGKESPNQ